MNTTLWDSARSPRKWNEPLYFTNDLVNNMCVPFWSVRSWNVQMASLGKAGGCWAAPGLGLGLTTWVFQFFRLHLKREIAQRNLPVLSCTTFLIILDSQIASAECSFLGVVAQILPLQEEYIRRLTWKNLQFILFLFIFCWLHLQESQTSPH